MVQRHIRMLRSIPRSGAVALCLTVALVWAYAPVLGELVGTWWSIADYSHGFFVVPAAAYLAWRRRESIPASMEPSAWGVVWIAAALLAEFMGMLTIIRPIEQYSILIAVTGVLLLVGGRVLLAWAWPLVAFLLFMIPLPHSVATWLAAPLQHAAAAGAVYLLQCFGVPALAEGTVIQLEHESLNVAFACSGLQMVISFGAVCTAIAMLSRYGLVGKCVIVASAIPIAIVSNVFRITLIAWAHGIHRTPPRQLHDAGGILIVPLTIALVFFGIHLFEMCFPKRRREKPTAARI